MSRQEDYVELEEIMDRLGLVHTIQQLVVICEERSETGGEDDSNADMWDVAAKILDDTIDDLPAGF